jgi:acetyl-CoA carboxylase biotin carboxyl carrier protein
LLTFEQIKELIELVAERHLQGLEVERSGFRLKIDGQAAAQPGVYISAPDAGETTAAPPPAAQPSRPAAAHAATAAPPAAGSATAAPAAAEKPGHAPGTHTLTSPIVGTFYRSPSPTAPAFVEVGSRVKKGQVLCIIEAMKLMNEIECDVDGVIAEIYPQNAQPVEFGEPLFAISPA